MTYFHVDNIEENILTYKTKRRISCISLYLDRAELQGFMHNKALCRQDILYTEHPFCPLICTFIHVAVSAPIAHAQNLTVQPVHKACTLL